MLRNSISRRGFSLLRLGYAANIAFRRPSALHIATYRTSSLHRSGFNTIRFSYSNKSLMARTYSTDVAEAAEMGEPKHTLFVGRCLPETTIDEIKGLFNKATNVRMPVNRVTGLPKGYAFVEFASEEDLKAAAQRTDFGGKPYVVNTATSTEARKVFVGNLSYDCTRDNIRDALATFGEVVSVRVPTDRITGKPRGFAFVLFAKEEAAKSAVERQFLEIGGRMAALKIVSGTPASRAPGGMEERGFRANRFRQV